MARSARQIAAQRKAALASARKRRRGRGPGPIRRAKFNIVGHGAAKLNLAKARHTKRRGRKLTKARANKRVYVAKNQQKIASKRFQRKGVNQYKRTGLVRPNGAKSFRKTMGQARFASKVNVVHGKKLAKHNKKINKLVAKTRKH